MSFFSCVQGEIINNDFASHRGYVLSGYNVGGNFKNNALAIVNTKTMSIIKKILLPHSWAKKICRDPKGNLWIGFSGNMNDNDNRVQIYSPDGNLLKAIKTDEDPGAGISFSSGRIFITCAENGFKGSVMVLDPGTFGLIKKIDLSMEGAPLMLITSAADEKNLIIAGLTSGEKETGYCVLTFINTETCEIESQVNLGENTDIWEIIPYNNMFYLLNSLSCRQDPEHAQDIIVVQPGKQPVITSLKAAPSPLWGNATGTYLYSYHNPEWNSTVIDSRRIISRLDLTNNTVKIWQLPEGFDAYDMSIKADKLFLTHWYFNSGTSDDGLYCFNPETGSLTLDFVFEDASSVLFPR